MIEIRDANGTLLATGDDEIICEYGPVCGFGCPDTGDVACGDRNPHVLIVRDAGGTTATATECDRGGRYQLTVEVKDSNGESLPGKKVKLGGGPKRKLGTWFDPVGDELYGPAIDDGRVSPR